MLQVLQYKGVDNTLDNIKRLILKWRSSNQLRVFDNWNIEKLFNYVSKQIPYVKDPENVPIYDNDNIELLKSPRQTILTGGDCDDKSILLGAIFERKGIPYRMKVVSTKPGQDYHHIYPEIFYRGAWRPFDATYPHNKIFAENYYHTAKIYDWSCGRTLTQEYKMPPGTYKPALSSSVVNSYGQIQGLGFDVASVVAAGLAIINAIFGGGKPIPPNINLAMQQIGKATEEVFKKYPNVFAVPAALDELTGLRAMSAVMTKKWGKIPPGKAIHDVWPNIPWSSEQQGIESAAAAYYPFLRWIHEMDKQGKPEFKNFDIHGLYDEFLSKSGPFYSRYAAELGQNKMTSAAGLGSLPILLLIGAAIYFISQKKKGRR